VSMATVVLDNPPPREIQELIERRRISGVDQRDEVWEGVLHMAPAPTGPHAYLGQQLAVLLGVPARTAGLVAAIQPFNLGESAEDYRVPDGALHRAIPRELWFPTAALVVEIVSPGDESWQKLPFYAAHNVDEVLIVDPAERTVHWLGLAGGEYRELQRSGLIDLGPAELAQRIDWP
jgi:Uma2 family endonuclease